MRAAGGNLTFLHLLQAYCVSQLHASPHPALRATFPPGEGRHLRRGECIENGRNYGTENHIIGKNIRFSGH